MGAKIAAIVFFLFFPHYSVPKLHSIANQQNTDFVLIKQDHNINIYAKWIKVDDTRSARQLRAEFFVNASFEKIVNVIKDDKRTTQWMKNTKTYYIIKTFDQNNWLSYVQFSVPWPFKNQDLIIKYDIPMPDAFSKYEIRFSGVPDYLEKNKNITRISHLEGVWRLMYLDKTKTKIEYEMFSRQAPAFPRWITDPIIQNNLISTMKAFREMVEK
jgi:hypothetical protein